MAQAKNIFIGSGIIFPIELNSEGRPTVHNDMDLVISSVKNILYWVKRTRFFNQSFGSRVHEIIEEPDDSVTKSLLRQFIVDAITDWDKRVDISHSDVEITSNRDGKVKAILKIRIRNTDIEDTFIFPFYNNITQ